MQTESKREPFRIPWTLGFCLFLAVAMFFLWEEHKLHILGALPYALFLLCPLLHFFMHRGHGGHRGRGPEDEYQARHQRGEGGVS